MTEGKVVQISGTARPAQGQGLLEGLVSGLNNVETYWRALKDATKAFNHDRSAATLLIRYAAKVWILHGGSRLGFMQTAENWIGQYEKSKGYDLTDEDDKEATDGKTAPPPKG